MRTLIGATVLLLGLSSAVITGTGLKKPNDATLNEPNPYIMELAQMNEGQLITLCDKLAAKKTKDKQSNDLEDRIMNDCDNKIAQIDKAFGEELKQLIEETEE